MSEQIGFIGVGRMGGRMVRRLLAAGYAVAVYDNDASSAEAAREHGARIATDAGDAAAGAAFVLCSLPDPAITKRALLGSGGAVAAMRSGATVIDLGTGDPGTARDIAEQCGAAGIAFLDAPVSRGVAAAETGELAILIGGRSEALERARPLLDVLASDLLHVGDVGAGQVAKLCNNMLAAITASALGEVLVAGVRAGVPLDALAAAISAGSGGSYVLDAYLPKGLFTAERPTGFSLDLMRKDIALFMRSADELDAVLPVSAVVQQLYSSAAAVGLGGADWTSVAELHERLADTRLTLDDRIEVGA